MRTIKYLGKQDGKKEEIRTKGEKNKVTVGEGTKWRQRKSGKTLLVSQQYTPLT